MRLTTRGRYAVMAMTDLAACSTETPTALVEIARRQDISLSYLEQLFGRLRRQGLVNSVRGPGGGYVLSREASEIRIAEIILAVDEPIETCRCAQEGLAPGEGCQHDGSRCLTHDLWDALASHIFLFLDRLTLEDVVRKRVGCPSQASGEASCVPVNAADALHSVPPGGQP
ncbi:Rrf2 family transcriptional regulator [Phaeovibrio sulfidiphilus]|uniref:Rrf2 family transcriptional regulator n=1 Tax=Phaeovibrio sulfidiphilus TaxID=1220600 RepID=A0A8J7CPA3_9PROT|nr:Rrf2 family transcriptional regulator [Phaeovibrio sulfidiphilus]MBE1236812.1 Rrf2 family transcriptional regulator [Phaeovibrio sulfidiphilus]